MKVLKFLSIIFLLFSCSQPENKLLDLGESTPLSAVEYSEELLTTSPQCLMLLENNLFVFQTRGDVVAIIMDTETGKQTDTWGRKGKGPGEFVRAEHRGTLSDNHTVYLYDTNSSGKLRKYKYDTIKNKLEIEEEVTFKPTSVFLAHGTVLDNGLIAGNVAFRQTPGSSLMILNKNGDILSEIVRFPDEAHKTKDLRRYAGNLSSYGNMFVYTVSMFGYIAFYEVTQDGSASLKWEHYLEKPLDKGDKSLDLRNLKSGFINTIVSKDYVFCSYCGKKYDDPFSSETLLVFDHKGKLLKNYALDRSINRIAVSPDGKTIYAGVYTPETGFVRFFPDLK